jgi:hypothetical protein
LRMKVKGMMIIDLVHWFISSLVFAYGLYSKTINEL